MMPAFDTSAVGAPRVPIDAAKLQQFVTQALPGIASAARGANLKVQQFGHGQSNPTYFLTWGPSRLVLRKKPEGKILASAHAVEREFKVLSALAKTTVPVPRPLALCEDSSVIGTPFYLMSFAQGRVYVDPNLPNVAPHARHDIYRAMCATMASLHGVDPVAVGLEGFGSPDNYCRRQLKRWSSQYMASVQHPMPAVRELMSWLESSIPAEDAHARPAICHGDYRLDNLVYAPDIDAAAAGGGRTSDGRGVFGSEKRVVAVLDWELCTLGNRWADVAYNCMAYHMPSGVPQLRRLGDVDGAAELGAAPGLPQGIPTEAEYLRWYCDVAGLPLPSPKDWAFYLALSLFRLTSILAGVQARARQGNASSAHAVAMSSDSVILSLATAGNNVIARAEGRPPAAWTAVVPSMPSQPTGSPLPSPGSLLSGAAGLGPKASSLRERLLAFMARRVYASEAVFEGHSVGPGRWTVHPLMEELKADARAEGLWNLWLPGHLAARLGHLLPLVPEGERGTLLGAGLSNLEYAHLCEVMGRSAWAPEVFNCSAPDTGNMEVLGKYGTRDQQAKWLVPLLRGNTRSCFAMTEKAVASSDATNVQASILRHPGAAPGSSSSSGGSGGGGEFHYIVNGVKWWTSGAMDPRCSVCIFMGKTDTTKPVHQQQSMVVVPMTAAGVKVVRPLMVFGFDDAPHGHAEVHFVDVAVPGSNMLLGEGRGFEIAQGRLGPGRLHHCMRLIGAGERALELMTARALSRSVFGGPIAKQGAFRAELAKRRIQLNSARLLVLAASDSLDRSGGSAKDAMGAIAQAKVAAPAAALAALDAAIQTHGGMGVCQDTPLTRLWSAARTLRIADGPDEVHLGTIAKMELAQSAAAMSKL